MKKVFAFMVAAVLVFAAGCGQNTTPSASVEAPDEWGVTLAAEDVTSTGMTLVCTQSGGSFKGELETGSSFTLERFAEGGWFPVDTRPGLDWAWTMEGRIIEPNAQTKWTVNWEWLYGRLESGTYRMSKVIKDFQGPGEYTEKTYYAEFGIVD